MTTLDTLPSRFVAKVTERHDGCWQWTGAVQSKGYGCYSVKGRAVLAHRFVLQATGRQIPTGMQVDHLCRNTRCVNPDHLDVVTDAVNQARRGASVTHCPVGHAYTASNTRRNGAGHRHCATCERARRSVSANAQSVAS